MRLLFRLRHFRVRKVSLKGTALEPSKVPYDVVTRGRATEYVLASLDRFCNYLRSSEPEVHGVVVIAIDPERMSPAPIAATIGVVFYSCNPIGRARTRND